MSPHQRMTQLDEAGEAYMVELGGSGQGREVFSHSEDWLELNSTNPLRPGLKEWVNLRHVGHLRIVEL